VRDGALLATVVGALSLAVALRGGRGESSAAIIFSRRPRRSADEAQAARRRSVVRRSAVAIAWIGLALATLALLLGHLVAPTLDPLWVGLLAVAFATLPAAALIGRST
jgi:hypothetical protein